MSLELGYIMAIACGIFLILVVIPGTAILIRLVYCRYIEIQVDIRHRELELQDMTDRPFEHS